MTIENRIVKEAKAKPEFIRIRLCDVHKVALHASRSFWMTDIPIQEIEKKLLAGEVKILGVPIRVGNPVEISATIC